MLTSWLRRDETPTLRGARVTLRAQQPGDFEEWQRVRRDSREFLKPFEPRWSEADLTRRAYLQRVRRCREEAARGTDFTFTIWLRAAAGDELAGGISLSSIRRRAAQFASLGYWMSREHTGRGLMTEAVGLVVQFAFDSLDLHRIHAATLPENAASRRVLEKNGFREEGYAEKYLKIDGAWCDHVLFGLTRERYQAGQAP